MERLSQLTSSIGVPPATAGAATYVEIARKMELSTLWCFGCGNDRTRFGS